MYARRAFGNAAGFLVGWGDWFNQIASLAYVSMTATVFLGTLWPPAAQYAKSEAVLIIVGLTAMHWVGLRIGGAVTRFISVTIGLMMLILIAACFIAPAVPAGAPIAMSAAGLPLLSAAMAAAVLLGACALLYGRIARHRRREASVTERSIEIGR